MLGRGLLANPFLCEQIKMHHNSNSTTHPGLRPPLPGRGAKESPPSEGCRNGGVGSPALPESANEVARLRAFHDEVFENYRTVIDGDLPMLGKMKEFWAYPVQNFSIRLHSAAARQDGRTFFKKVKKCHRLATYQDIVSEFLSDAEWSA